ncbi:hypothetical protein PCANC_09740 [Puccinia coronata f. sp. avenae]|uniref:Uncharacterized protein n=1 Tax=Puccinia coronata f. sp. avenae TaxID=200324 RepID=A0A2N5V7H4_9BASI|nr:hypothetical protein PCANC_09740 [Puccinia coronata f. sp. avenae]
MNRLSISGISTGINLSAHRGELRPLMRQSIVQLRAAFRCTEPPAKLVLEL